MGNTYRNDLIVEAMEKLGKTNESLAHATGLSHATISAIRNGRPNVQLATLRVIARELHLSMGQIVTLEEDEVVPANAVG